MIQMNFFKIKKEPNSVKKAQIATLADTILHRPS